jgi:hypothetical protein
VAVLYSGDVTAEETGESDDTAGRGGSQSPKDPRCPGQIANALASMLLDSFPAADPAASLANLTGHVVLVGIDASGAIGLGTLALSAHGGVALAFDPKGNVALLSTGGAGGGFAAPAGGVIGPEVGYMPNTTSVSQLQSGSTITSSIGGGVVYGGAVSVDLEGNVTVTGGAAGGVVTSSTVDFTHVTIIKCDDKQD